MREATREELLERVEAAEAKAASHLEAWSKQSDRADAAERELRQLKVARECSKCDTPLAPDAKVCCWTCYEFWTSSDLATGRNAQRRECASRGCVWCAEQIKQHDREVDEEIAVELARRETP